MTAPPRFLCDEMLGKLASWLRLAGYDARYRKDVADDELLREAAEDGRVLLTRDAELARRTPDPPGALLLEALDPREQLAEVVDGLSLAVPGDRVLSRCSVCNTLLEEAEPHEVADEVPPEALDAHETYQRCPGCGRVYWPGTHVDAILDVLESLGGGR